MYKKNKIFVWKSSRHTPLKVQSDNFCRLVKNQLWQIRFYNELNLRLRVNSAKYNAQFGLCLKLA